MKFGYTVPSAGTNPAGLSSRAVKAMLEAGLDISDQTSKHLDEVSWEKADYAITLCSSADEECVNMNWPETCIREHWPIEDPETEDDFRKVRDEIKTRIKVWIKALQH